MDAALAVRGEDDRPVRRRLAQELLIGGEHVAIGEIERAPGIVLAGQEGAERRLAVFAAPRSRRPQLNALAWLRTNKARPVLRFADRRAGRSRPRIRGSWSGGRRRPRRAGAARRARSPAASRATDCRRCRAARSTAAPARVVGAARHRHGAELGARHHRPAHQLLLEQPVGDRAGDEEHGAARRRTREI